MEKPNKPIYISSESDSSSHSDDSESSSDVAVFVGVNPNPSRRPGYCKMCEINIMDVMFFPCHHASICMECYEKLPNPKKCPSCGAVITKKETFYLS